MHSNKSIGILNSNVLVFNTCKQTTINNLNTDMLILFEPILVKHMKYTFNKLCDKQNEQQRS